MKRIVQSVLICLWVFVLGCVSARMSDHASDRLFQSGKYDEAAVRLKKGLEKQGKEGQDIFLYWVDIGLSLHSAGHFEESNQFFFQADRLSEIKDYTSLATEAETLLTGENVKAYLGEDFEKILVNVYLAINYALMKDTENALVEARKVNRKIYLMVNEGKKKYKENAFARYLSALLYEDEGNDNDAYLDYKNTYKIKPDFPYLGHDLWREAKALHLEDDAKKWDSTFHLTAEDHRQAIHDPQLGEIVVLYENGISPIKRPNPQFRTIPKFYPRNNPVQSAGVEVNGELKGVTFQIENIEENAIQNLDEKYAGIIAKRLLGLGVKGAIAYGIGRETKNPALGLLAGFLLSETDQADLRSWNLLPKDFQVFRTSFLPGTYSVQLKPIGGDPLPAQSVVVRKGRKSFMNFRYMPKGV